MEPMDLDDDTDSGRHTPQTLYSGRHTPQTLHSGRHTPQTFHSPARTDHRVPNLRTSSVSSFSPLVFQDHLKTHDQPQFDQRSAIASSTPVYRHSASSPYTQGNASLLRSAVFGSTANSSHASSPPTQRSFSRGGTPMRESFENQSSFGAAVSDGHSCVSLAASDQSYESEMEVVQTSPSPTWDRVRAALSNISLLTSESNTEQAANKVSLDKTGNTVKNEVVKTSGHSTASWEPSLTAVQAATTFRRGKREKKSSPTKSTEASTQSLTPMRKLVERATDRNVGSSTSALRKQIRPKAASLTPEKSRFCSLGLCTVSIAVLAIICVVLLQLRHAVVSPENFANMDAELLRNELESRVFGQHIATEIIPKSIDRYLRVVRAANGSCNDDSCFNPPLVLSFHGWTGVGKNFVSDIITKLFPAKTVTKFLVPHHFPHRHLDQRYQNQIKHWVLSNVTDFRVNFFIFDEMDKATPGVVQGIQNAIKKLGQRNSHRSPSVFMFLSNSFGANINQLVFDAMIEGHDREKLSTDDFVQLFADQKNTWYYQLKSSSAITATVPFLPLEKEHIVQCIHRDLVFKSLSTRADIVDRVVGELSFTVLPGGQQFSQTGCKRVSDKVNLVVFNLKT